MTTGKRLIHPYHHRTELVALGLSPDGRHLASGSWVGEDYEAGGDLQIWDIATGRLVNHIGPVRGGVGWPDYAQTIQWSPDGNWLAIAASTSSIQVYKPFDFEMRPYDEVDPTDGWSRPPSFCWAPDSQRIFVSCWRSSYDPRTGKQIEPLTVPDVPGCIATVGSLERLEWMVPGIPPGAWRPALSEGTEQRIEPPLELRWGREHLLLSGSHSQLLCIDPKSKGLRWLETSYLCEALDPRGEVIAVTNGEAVELHDGGTGAALAWAAMPGAPAAELFWNHSGNRLAVIESVGDDEDARSGVRLYAIDRAERRCTLLGRLEVAPKARGRWEGDFRNFAWSGDGRAIAFLDEEDQVQVWSVEATPRRVAAQTIDDTRGLCWGPSRRLIAWSPVAIHFIDVDAAGSKISVDTRGLLDNPPDDGPFAPEQLSAFRSAQFPLGPKGARQWAALLDDVLIVPKGLDAEADRVVGWSDGQTSTPLSTQPVKRFGSFADAARVPKTLPVEVAEALGAGAPKARRAWGPSEEPRELFDLYALLELDAAAAGESSAQSWHLIAMAHLYHRAGKDPEALRALDRSTQWHDQARARLTLALHSAVRGERGRARLYRDSTDDALLARAAKQVPSLIPQIDALLGGVETLLGKDARALIERAAAQIEPENNQGEKRARVVRAYAAIGDLDKAVSFAADLKQRAVPVIADAVHLGLPAFARLARACASSEFAVMDAVVDGFIELKAYDEALACLEWFEGLSTSEAEQRIRLAQLPPAPLAPAVEPDPERAKKLIAELDLDKHWEVEKAASSLAELGDYEGAFAVLQRLPKSKRSYAIPGAAIAIAHRVAAEPDSRAMAALYSLLEALPSDISGSNGRAYETSRVLRIIQNWPRAQRDGLID